MRVRDVRMRVRDVRDDPSGDDETLTTQRVRDYHVPPDDETLALGLPV